MLISSDFLYNLIQQIVEKLVRVLMHGTPEELVDLLELVDERARRDGALVRRVLGDEDE